MKFWHSPQQWFTTQQLRLFIRLHNYAYSKISGLSIVYNQGEHPKHKILNYYQFFVDNILPGEYVLDLGCGDGINAYHAADKAREVVAVDFEEKNIARARRKYAKPNITYLIGDILSYTFEKKFDKIILSNVLEHIQDRVDFLQQLKNLSDVILLRVPMITRDWLPVFKKNEGYEYRLDDTHFIEFTLENLQQEVRQAGWELKSYSMQFGELWGILKKVNG